MKENETAFVCPGGETGSLVRLRREDGDRDDVGTRSADIEFSYRVTSK